MQPLQGTLFGAEEPGVDPGVPFERVRLDATSVVDVARGWLHGADSLLQHLAEVVPWEQGRRWMYERMVADPRLSRWYSTSGVLPHPVLGTIIDELSAHYGVPFGGVGLNYYRDGRDSVAFHRDRELRHLDRTLVAIVTLGALRSFLLRPHGGGPSIDLRPGSGDLIVMGGRCQSDWEHSVPKVARTGPRISISTRWSSGEGEAVRRPRRRRRTSVAPRA